MIIHKFLYRGGYFVKDNVIVYFYNIKEDNFFNWFELVSSSFHVIPFEESVFKK